jgi:purine-binding chemotaxis protein CheW
MNQAEQTITDIAAQIGMSSDENQYLTFMLADEEYGIDILCVQEIKGWDKATPIPNSPAYLQGVINLRGAIVPVIDLRQLFGMEKLEYGPMTVVIVLRIRDQASERIMGIVVDAVSDVYNIPEEKLGPPPRSVSTQACNSVKGLASVDNKMVILLDVDQMMTDGDMVAVEELAQ